MKLCTNGAVAVYSFLLSCLFSMLAFLVCFNWSHHQLPQEFWISFFLLIVLFDLLVIFLVFRRRGYLYKVAWRAGLLGAVFALGTLVTLVSGSSWRVFGIYLALLSFFHFSEFVTISVINPKSLKLDSFMLSHSREYHIAAVSSWLEFAVERYFVPEMKQLWWLSAFGVFLCVAGEFIRKLSMFTAGPNFNHVIQSYREDGHVLVTTGIYSKFRHPSYAGWLYWSVGTQILLINPLCSVGYALASWFFFKTRIEEEEKLLLNFFGEDYVMYQRRVSTGIPFVKGYNKYC